MSIRVEHGTEAPSAPAASHRITKVRAAFKPAVSGLSSSVTVRRSAAPPSPKGRLKRCLKAKLVKRGSSKFAVKNKKRSDLPKGKPLRFFVCEF